MIRRFSADLKLPFETDMRSKVEKDLDFRKLNHFSFEENDFDPRVLAFLDERGLQVSHYEVFYTPPRAMLAVHADGAKLSNIIKLNWVFGGKDSRMMWWKLKSDDALKLLETNIGTPYLYAEQKNCIMVESVAITSPTLVNVGQLHSVINTGPERRWCLSVVLAKKGVDKNLEWDEAMELFDGELK